MAARWEYLILDLAHLPEKASEVDLLNEAGEQGWELTTILSNKTAYLRRLIDDPAHEPESLASVRSTRRKTTAPRAE